MPNMAGWMQRRKLFISMGVLFAILACTLNFSLLARRTLTSSESSGSISSFELSGELRRNGSHFIVSEGIGVKYFTQGSDHAKNETIRKSPDVAEYTVEKKDTNIAQSIRRSMEKNVENLESAWLDSCQRLGAHENGHWHHHTHFERNNSSFLNDQSIRQMYFPEEMRWLRGENFPRDGFGKCTPSRKFLMYNSLVGHQCGCGVRGFAPSHSVWVHNETFASRETEPHPVRDHHASSPTLRLAKRLADADATLCFSGDSIDYQIYAAMHNNLRRIDQLHQIYRPDEERLVSVVSREIPVTHRYHTEPGEVDDWFLRGRRPPDGDGSFLHAIRPPPGGFGSMYSILETKAFLRDDRNGTKKRARFRYYMSYGWSPWNVAFMEDCNVVMMNLGLHYNPDGDHMGRETRHTLMNDTLAAITYLTNFTASETRRVAVWRSALPQHFATHDGHFYRWKKLRKDHSCAAIKKVNPPAQQVYNKAYDEAFEACRTGHPESAKRPCDHLRHSCTLDPAAEVDYQTIYKFWRDNNCTDHVARERSRRGDLRGAGGGRAVTGTILRWRIFDLFDVTSWHSKDRDCSHVCYVPQLWEAAFERLYLLLSPYLASF